MFETDGLALIILAGVIGLVKTRGCVEIWKIEAPVAAILVDSALTIKTAKNKRREEIAWTY